MPSSVARLHVMVTVTCPHDPALQYRATSYTIEDALRRVVRLTANTRVAPWIEITLSTKYHRVFSKFLGSSATSVRT